MKKNELLWKSDNGDGTFDNPVLFADYSDPDVIRVGDTYYMTASSFNYTPGLPILISKDLVNWTLAGYALENIPEARFAVPGHSEGVWAPAIRYFAQRFYIYYGMPDEGIYMVSASDPLGRWDEPVCVKEGKGLIDPCPFWDDDGRAYVIHAYAKSRAGYNNILAIFEMTPDGRRALTEDVHIFNADGKHRTMEGPKAYKKNSRYLILTPAGGVAQGWQVALMSDDIMGPYEDRIVMRQGTSLINGPHQGGMVDVFEGGAHHFYPGDGAEDKAQREYFVHFQDKGRYGRIVHVQSVRWEDGFPVIGAPLGSDGSYPEGMDEKCLGHEAKTGCGEPVIHMQKPVETGEMPVYLEASDDFDGETLSLIWQWQGNHKREWYSLSENPGSLRLYGQNPAGDEKAPLWAMSNVLTQKPVCPSFKARVNLDASCLKDGDRAGLLMTGETYCALEVKNEGGELILSLTESERDEAAPCGVLEKSAQLRKLEKPQLSFFIELRESGDEQFRIGYDAGAGDIYAQTAYIPESDHWTGVRLGIYAVSRHADGGGFADFSKFKVTAI